MNTRLMIPALAAITLAAAANASFAQNALWQTQNNAGWHALDTGNYGEAAKQFDAAIRTAQKFPAPDMRYAISLSGRANVNQMQGDLRSAQGLYEQSLAITEKAVGAQNRGVAAILDRLASVYQEQGQYTRAQPLLQRALSTREKLLGADHLLVGASSGRLASCYADEGKYDQAIPLFDSALAIYRNKLGDKDPLTAATLFNLATAHAKQSQFKKAADYYQQSLAAWEQARATDHEDYTSCLVGLAEVHIAQNAAGEALPLLTKALALQEVQNGVDHPTVAKTSFLLGKYYQQQKQVSQAEAQFQGALSRYEKGGGVANTSLAEVVDSYANLLNENGRGEEVQALQSHYAPAFLARAWERLSTGQGTAGEDASAYVASKGWTDPQSTTAAIVGYFGYRQIGRDAEADELLDEAAANADRNAWPYPLVSYLKSEIDGNRLLGLARDNEKMVLAQACFGLILTQRAQHANAITHFDWVQKHASQSAPEYQVAVAELERIRSRGQAPDTQPPPAISAVRR